MEDIDGECEIWRGCYIWIQAVVADMDWDEGYCTLFEMGERVDTM